MNTKSSAHYQREYRKRLREQGLVKKEVWIHPDNSGLLNAIEKQLRSTKQPPLAESNWKTGVKAMTNPMKSWSTSSLYEALKGVELSTSGSASIELIEGIDPTIHIIMRAYGDLPLFLTVAGEQIIVEAVLWSSEEIDDIAGFNDTILRTHKYFPLSTISLDSMSDKRDYYHMFGALSSTSLLQNVVFEIEVLASNVIQATAAYSGFLKTPVEA